MFISIQPWASFPLPFAALTNHILHERLKSHTEESWTLESDRMVLEV